MTTSELTEKFLLWFQEKYPDARIYRNNTGIAWRHLNTGGKVPVKFGIPLPQGKGKAGGGPDWIAFMSMFSKCGECGGAPIGLSVMFFEIKLKNHKMSKEQKKFADLMTSLGGEYFIVKEIKNSWTLIKWQKQDNFCQDYNCKHFIIDNKGCCELDECEKRNRL
jgi:hypothetical protein